MSAKNDKTNIKGSQGEEWGLDTTKYLCVILFNANLCLSSQVSLKERRNPGNNKKKQTTFQLLKIQVCKHRWNSDFSR
jgi:hypothetical protein